MRSDNNSHTSIALHKSTKERFERTKPYDTISADEFADALLDVWEYHWSNTESASNYQKNEQISGEESIGEGE